jgi:hypothetical protein
MTRKTKKMKKSKKIKKTKNNTKKCIYTDEAKRLTREIKSINTSLKRLI